MSKCKITGKVLSIRLGREQTQLALVSGGSEILHSISVDTPVGAVEDGVIRNPEAVRGMLRAVLKTPEFKRVRQTVFALCTTQVVSETVTVHDMPDAKLEKLLQANMDQYIPVDVQDYKLVWQSIGARTTEDGQKKLDVQLWAVPTGLLAPYYSVANSCGLSVVAIDYCGHSVATAVGASFARPVHAVKERKKLDLNKPITFGGKDKQVEPVAAVATEDRIVPDTQLHILLETDMVGMTFVQNGQVVMQRFIQCGSDPAELFGEIAMMLEYFRSMEVGRGSNISVLLSGSLSTEVILMNELSDMLGIPLGIFSSRCKPSLLLCAGAAHTTLDFGVATLNSASKARKQVSNNLWQYLMILLGGLVLVGAVMITMSSKLVWDAEISSLKGVQNALTIQAAKSNGFADNYNRYRSEYERYSSDWDTIFGSLQTYNDNLVLVVEELETIMPEDTDVVQLLIASNGMQVTFACETKEEAAYLIMALRELQYADLAQISSLQGGGKGPATSYGSGETEKAPTEGSGPRTADQTEVVDLISEQINSEALMHLAKNMTAEQFEELERTYGKEPETLAPSLEDLKTENKETLTDDVRKEAMTQMFMNDPFADNHFADLLAEDVMRENPILMNYIMADIIILEKEGKLDFGTADNPVTVRNQMEVVVEVLTKDTATMDAVERLLATEEYMENTYIHYLEVELGLREDEKVPYLDMEKVFEDVLEGGFQTNDPELNEALDALITDETWTLIDDMNSDEKMGELLLRYLVEGTTDIPVVDALIENYLYTGTTGYTALDSKLDAFIDSGKVDKLVADMVISYMTTGSSGSIIADGLIYNYLYNGSTGNGRVDGVINDYMQSDAMEDLMSDVLENYLTNGTTGNKTLDSMLESFLTTGTTGNTAVDGVIKSYMQSGKMNDLMGEMFGKYLTTGTTGNALLDSLVTKFMTTGTTDNPVMDELILDYLENGEMGDVMGELMDKYLTTGTTGNKTLDDMIKNYMNNGTTGNKAMDDLIKDYLEDLVGGDEEDDPMDGVDKDMMLDMLNKYLSTGTTGNPLYDALIDKYMKEGTTGNPALDKTIEDYISSGEFDPMFKEMIDNYLKKGTTGNKTLDELISKYLKDGTTGNKVLDKLIKDYLNDYLLNGDKDSLDDLLNNLLGGGLGGIQPTDTRIYFTAVLAYNDELKEAELLRKGMYYEDKVEGLEVAE